VSIRCTVKSDPAVGVVRVAVVATWTKSPRFTRRRATTPVERRHDLLIGEQRLDPLHGRGGDVDLVGARARFASATLRSALAISAPARTSSSVPVADKMSLRTQLLPASQQGVLKRMLAL